MIISASSWASLEELEDLAANIGLTNHLPQTLLGQEVATLLGILEPPPGEFSLILKR